MGLPRLPLVLVFLLFFKECQSNITVKEAVKTWTKPGDSAELVCLLNRTAEECVFIDPIGTKYCSPGGDDETCAATIYNRFKVSDDNNACKLTLDNVYESDIGTWKCKAMFWEDWSEANLEVAMFETDSAEVGFHILYGEVDVEIDKSQEFSCDLNYYGDGTGEIQWFISTKDGKDRKPLPETKSHEVDDSDLDEKAGSKTIRSFTNYQPKLSDHGKKITCINPQSGKEDHIFLELWKYDGPSNLPVIEAFEGYNKSVSVELSSFPAPEVMWHLNSNKIVLKPGDTSEDGKYQAEYVTTVAENRYKIGLIIKNVSAEFANAENLLHIKISDTKELKFPVKIKIVEDIPENEPGDDGKGADTTLSIPSDADGVPNPDEKNDNPASVKEGGFGLWIIFGIIAFLIILCCVYCCCRKRGNKNNGETQEDIEKNINQMENIENKPLLKADNLETKSKPSFAEEKSKISEEQQKEVDDITKNIETGLKKTDDDVKDKKDGIAAVNSINTVDENANTIIPNNAESGVDEIDKTYKSDDKSASTADKTNMNINENMKIAISGTGVNKMPTNFQNLKDKDSEEHLDIKSSAAQLREMLQQNGLEAEKDSGSINGVEPPKEAEKKTTLSRTSSIELNMSKTIVLGEESKKSESSTLNIEKFGTVEFKLKVSPSHTNVDQQSQKSLSSNYQEEMKKKIKSNSDGESDGTSDDDQTTNIVLSTVPSKQQNKDKGLQVVGKPPTVPRSPSEATKYTFEMNGSRAVSRSNSFTSDAGTQTPRIKAKAKLYFDDNGGSVSASEESLSDAVAKEALQREVAMLKEELERKGKKDD